MSSPLVRLAKFPEAYPAMGLTTAALRWQIFNEENNGLREAGAVLRVGRAVYLDPQRYFDWVRTNPQNAPRPAKGAAS